MDFREIFEACIKIGAPMTFLSWMMFSWLHAQGKLDVSAGRKAISDELKQIKKTAKAEKVAADKAKPPKKKRAFKQFLQFDDSTQIQAEDNADYIFHRWMWFGGGFYGLAALWTFVIVEVLDVVTFIYTFPGFSAFFEPGIVSILVQFLVNQITNILSAFIWFNYWSEASLLIWIAVAYIGYLLGIEIAKRQARN